LAPASPQPSGIGRRSICSLFFFFLCILPPAVDPFFKVPSPVPLFLFRSLFPRPDSFSPLFEGIPKKNCRPFFSPWLSPPPTLYFLFCLYQLAQRNGLGVLFPFDELFLGVFEAPPLWHHLPQLVDWSRPPSPLGFKVLFSCCLEILYFPLYWRGSWSASLPAAFPDHCWFPPALSQPPFLISRYHFPWYRVASTCFCAC